MPADPRRGLARTESGEIRRVEVERDLVGGDHEGVFGFGIVGEYILVEYGDVVLSAAYDREGLAGGEGDRAFIRVERKHSARNAAADRALRRNAGGEYVGEGYIREVRIELVAEHGRGCGDGDRVGRAHFFRAAVGMGDESYDRAARRLTGDDAVGVDSRHGRIAGRPAALSDYAVERRVLRGELDAPADRYAARRGIERDALHFLIGDLDIATRARLLGLCDHEKAAIGADHHRALARVGKGRGGDAAELVRGGLDIFDAPLERVRSRRMRRQHLGFEQRGKIDGEVAVRVLSEIGEIDGQSVRGERDGIHAYVDFLRNIAAYQPNGKHHYQRYDDKDAYHQFFHRDNSSAARGTVCLRAHFTTYARGEATVLTPLERARVANYAQNTDFSAKFLGKNVPFSAENPAFAGFFAWHMTG